MKQNQEFRQAQPQDMPRLFQLYQNAILSMKNQKIDQWDEIYPDETILRQDIAKKEMFVLDQQGELLAAVVLNEEQDVQYRDVDWQYSQGKIGVIHRLCVNGTHHGKGYGRQIAQLAEEYFRSHGYTSIRLDAFPKNPAAARLYPSLGYVSRGTILLRKGVFDCFEKSLLPAESE